MVPLTVFHIDDNLFDIISVQKQIEYMAGISYLGYETNPDKGLQCLSKLKPDLLLLDIKMPGTGGIKIAKKITDMCIQVVFLTSHSEFALEAFDCMAFSYLVKPLQPERLQEIVHRVYQLKNKWTLDINEQPSRISVPMAEQKIERIFINNHKEILILQIRDIAYIQARGAYTEFNMKDKSVHLSSKLLKTYVSTLEKCSGFLRIHRSFIINKKFIKLIEKQKAMLKIVFANESSIKLGRLSMADWYEKLQT